MTFSIICPHCKQASKILRTGKKRFEYSCQGCGKSFNLISEITVTKLSGSLFSIYTAFTLFGMAYCTQMLPRHTAIILTIGVALLVLAPAAFFSSLMVLIHNYLTCTDSKNKFFLYLSNFLYVCSFTLILYIIYIIT